MPGIKSKPVLMHIIIAQQLPEFFNKRDTLSDDCRFRSMLPVIGINFVNQSKNVVTDKLGLVIVAWLV
jgi:hypothetical protein